MTSGQKAGILIAVLVVAFVAAWFGSWKAIKNRRNLETYTMQEHLETLRASRQTKEKFAIKMFFTSGMGVMIIPMIIVIAKASAANTIKDLHGSARWAKLDDIKKTNLLDGKGLYVGGFKKGKELHHLRDDSNTHLLAFAPTRSGKGVALILPTLLTNHDKSFFVYDIKGENYALTSGWRASAGNTIYKFEPASFESHRYNPLDEIVFGSPSFTKDVQTLADILHSSGDGKGKGEDHWTSKARELSTALIIYALEDPSRDNTLYYIGNLLTDPEKDLEETIETLVETCRHRDAKNILVKLRNTPEKERGSIISTFARAFELYSDPIIRRNTETSDFKINDLVNGDTPTSLYFIIQPNDLSRLSNIARIFVTQMLNKLIHGMEFEGGTSKQKNLHQLILMLDEFASMRYMPVIEEGLAFIAGYGVRAYIIVQDIEQIYKYYTRENGIIGNCHTQIAYAPNNNATKRHVSEQLGKMTIVQKKVTKSSGGGKGSSTSRSTQEVGRELLTPEEAGRLKMIDVDDKGNEGGETLVMQSGNFPIKGTRVLYFLNDTLSARSKVAAYKIDRIVQEGFKLDMDSEYSTTPSKPTSTEPETSFASSFEDDIM